ncbi:MAG: HAD family hydrolase, partial [Anaerolineae bacterium]
VGYVRPSKSLADVEVRSVRKKWKDKAFTAAISRQEIEHYTAELGEPLDEHIQTVLSALQGIAADLGLG